MGVTDALIVATGPDFRAAAPPGHAGPGERNTQTAGPPADESAGTPDTGNDEKGCPMTVSAPAAADPTLRRRLQTIEMCGLVSRTIGLLCTLSVVTEWPYPRAVTLPPVLVVACYGGIAVMAAANVLSVAAVRRPGGSRYHWLSAGQMALDTLLVVAMVAVFALYDERTTWPLLAVPIVVAAIRHRLRGTLTVWAVTSASFAAVALHLPDRTVLTEDVPFAVGMHLLIALVTGTQSAAFARQLTDLQATRIALQHRATHDGLTGLPNRARLAEHADRHAGEAMAVLLLDLDGFKPVNDRLGHAAGDDLLRQVAERLGRSLRPGDLAGRLGGDEFLVIAPGVGPGGIEPLRLRVERELRAPIRWEGRLLPVGASVGAAGTADAATATAADLTAAADADMYARKRAARCAPAAGALTVTGGREPVPASADAGGPYAERHRV